MSAEGIGRAIGSACRKAIDEANARADAAEKRVGELEGERDRLSEIMRGWTWHEGRIEGPSQKVANGAYVLESIRLAAFREVGDILALRAHEARKEKA